MRWGWSVGDRLPRPGANQWFAMRVMAGSRVAIAMLLLIPLLVLPAGGVQVNDLIEPMADKRGFALTGTVYLLAAIGFLALIFLSRRRWFHLQLLLQGSSDILALAALAHFAGHLHGGIAVLLLVSVAGAAVLSTSTMAGYFAALAALLLIGESLYAVSFGTASPGLIWQSALVGLGCFVTAYLINWLAGRLDRQERLARQRGEDLQNQLAITQLVIAELPHGVAVVEGSGRLMMANRAALTLLDGRARVGDHLLAPSGEVTASGSNVVEQLGAALATWRARRSPRPESEEMILHSARDAEGLRIRIRFLAARPEDDAGDTVMVIENLRSIEDRAQQLKLAAMGRLSASIAHEIRNPLAAIRHANSLLAEQLGELGGPAEDMAPLRRMAGIVETNCGRINRIVEDVLSISRRDPPALEAIELHSFLLTFLSEFSASQPAGGLGERVSLVLQSPLPMWFDPNHLRQVLVNVLGNACRYASTQPGAIRIEWRQQSDDRLELAIADDGPGLAPEVMQHLFEPFFTTESRGTGLGLYLARELCFANSAGIRSQRRAGDTRHPAEFVIEPRPRPRWQDLGAPAAGELRRQAPLTAAAVTEPGLIQERP